MSQLTPVTAAGTPAARSASTPAPSLAIRALDLVASEWTKFRSVRSSFWSLLVAVVTPIGASALVAFAFANAPASAGPPPDPLLPEVLSLEYAVIAVSVMGVLAFSAEYSTGLIRTTFTAAPRRRAVLAAKAVVLGTATLAAGELVAFASFFLVQAILAGHHQGVSLSRPGVPGAVLAAGILLCVCTMLGLALGSIIRHTAGGIAATIAVIVLPSILGLLPAPWNGRIGRFTLLDAARQVSGPAPGREPVLAGAVPAGPAGLAGCRAGAGRRPHHPPGHLRARHLLAGTSQDLAPPLKRAPRRGSRRAG